MLRCRSCLLVLWTIIVGGLAWPVDAQTIPGSAAPDRIERRFDPPKQPRSTTEPLVPELPSDRGVPAGAADIKFILSGVVVEGSTVYADSALLPLYEAYLGKEISLRTVYGIARAITAKYRNDGYILSRAVVPPQRIRGGTIIIRVIEGFVDNVIIEGRRRDVRGMIQAYADKITRSRPLQVADLERYLLLIRDLPGIHAEGLLRPARNVPGASQLVIQVSYKPVGAALGADNRGSRFVGPLQITTSLTENSLLGLSERTGVRFVTTGVNSVEERRELAHFEVDHAIPVTTEGTLLSVRATRSLSDPGFTLRSSNVKNRSTKVTLGLSHPLIRSRSQNLSAAIRMTYQRAKVSLLGAPLSDDRISALRTSMSYDFVDRLRGVNFVEIGIDKGLDLFDNSDVDAALQSRSKGRSDFTKFVANASRLQNLVGSLNLFIAATAQYSLDRLLSAEEFGVGGASIGRGYDPSEITGDHGVSAKAELQFGRSTTLSYLKGFQFYGFYDFGAVYQVENNSRESIASTGLGIRFNLTDYFSGYVEAAKPLTRPFATAGEDDGNDPRYFFSMTLRY